MNAARARLESSLFSVLLAVARRAPRRWLLGLGAWTGRLGYLLDARHRRIALENLALAHGDALTAAERRRIVRRSWEHFGRVTFDALALARFSRDSVGREIRYEGLEHIRAAYQRGRGVLLFSAHFGHWELVALMQGHLGLPLSLVTRPLDNPLLETRLARLRGLSGNRVIHKRRAVREMLRVLGEGSGVAILLDQDARGEGVFVPFFGRPASTTPTLALLALRTDAAVVPVFSVPLEDGSYRIVYEPAVPVERTADRERDVVRLTAECTAIIERWVRRHPELWLWMHRRWKTAPPPDGQPD